MIVRNSILLDVTSKSLEINGFRFFSCRNAGKLTSQLTNGFSKKIENLEHAVALHFMHYNFARIHKTLRVTPAMEAGVEDHVWTLEQIAALTD